MKFDTIEAAIEEIKQGKMIIVIDDEDRENEGDFVMAADLVTPEAINFMAKYGRGMICAPITKERAHELELDYMVKSNNSLHATPFTVTIDLIKGNTTGISASDRANTILALCDGETKPSDFYRPGHIFPLIARDKGVLERNGHTEAAVDFSKLAGRYPCGVICEIMNDDGTMARVPELMEIAKEHDLRIVTIKDLVEYIQNQNKIVKTNQLEFPTKMGTFNLHRYESVDGKEHHMAITKGDLTDGEAPIVRIHSECFTGDIFGSLRCDCGDQLNLALKNIEEAGRGILLYMKQEGRGIGLKMKLSAYELQDKGMDTVEANEHLGFDADLREYSFAAQMLKDLGVNSVRLMTNNPRKIEGLSGNGIEIKERLSHESEPNDINLNYLLTKKSKLGHLILDDSNHLH